MTLTKRQARQLVGDRDGWACRYCRRPLHQPPREGEPEPAAGSSAGATLEHLVPPPRIRPRPAWQLADLANLALSCVPCNTDKGNLTDDEYRLVLAYRRLVATAELTQAEAGSHLLPVVASDLLGQLGSHEHTFDPGDPASRAFPLVAARALGQLGHDPAPPPERFLPVLPNAHALSPRDSARTCPRNDRTGSAR